MNRIQIELMNKLARGWELYETIRTIPPVEHQRIWMESLRGDFSFDIEWAKRGGVVKTSVCEQPEFAKCLGVKQDGRALFMFFINEDENERWLYGFVFPQNFNTLSMATPTECAEAGIEYIEQPARWLPIEVFPPPQYTWLGDEQDKPKIISVDDWEDYEIRNNRSIVCNKSGLVVEAYEWFGKWYHLVNDGGDCYQQLINPTHFQYLPKPPKDE